MRHFTRHQGFTLVELMVTVAIVGLLASVALPLAELTVQRNREHELHHALREIRTALDAYKQAVSEGHIARTLNDTGYPPSLRVLMEGVPDASSPDKKMLYFLRRIPRDPMSDDPSRTNEESWGKRSYTSSAEAPEEGNDVFDVYSRSPAIGLNGVPYKDW